MEAFIQGSLAAVLMMILIFMADYFSRISWKVDLEMAPDASKLIEYCHKIQSKRSALVLNLIGASLVAMGTLMIALCIFADVPGPGWENFVGGAIYFIGISLWMRPYEKAADQYFREIGLAP